MPYSSRALEKATDIVHATMTTKHAFKPFIEEITACGLWCDDLQRYKLVEMTAKVTCLDCIALEGS